MGNQTILVVDDNIELSENIKDLLEMEGYAVTTAYDGNGALELVKDRNFDLVLLDLVMPGVDGLEVLAKLKQVTPATPVIIVTAFTEEEKLEDARRAGAVDCIKKPIDMNSLVNNIRSLLKAG